MDSWLLATLDTIWKTAATVFVVYTVIVILVRWGGLRTFAKMSSFDFASTVAMGSILATIVMNVNTSILQGTVALATIILYQQIFSGLKLRIPGFSAAVENEPTLLMDGDNFLEDNMKRTGVSRSELIAKLREANVTDRRQIKAIILETTGDVTVLHGPPDEALDKLMMEGVVR